MEKVIKLKMQNGYGNLYFTKKKINYTHSQYENIWQLYSKPSYKKQKIFNDWKSDLKNACIDNNLKMSVRGNGYYFSILASGSFENADTGEIIKALIYITHSGDYIQIIE